MSRFLVTGGAGFIGSHITERLLKEGNFVRVLDNFSSGKRENLGFIKGLSPQDKKQGLSPTELTHREPRGTLPNFELIEGDIRDKSTCDKACQGIDAVLHQAALRSVPKSMKDPESYNDVNIGGTLNMLQSASRNKVKRFVFASSSSVYGEAIRFPEKESDLPKLISPYALTKLAGEHYCKVFAKNYGLNAVSLRYFNVFGPRQSLDDEYAVVIPKFISCMLKDESPPIYGDGKQSRDFTYVGNIVEANILAAERGGFQGEVFNIASGKDYSILELAEILNRIMKKEIKPIFLKPRPGDVFRTLADLAQAKKIGFKPDVDFVEGLKLTVAYFKENV